MKKEKMCGSCKQGEIYDEPATCKATGHNGENPFRIFLCDSHSRMYENDFENIKIMPFKEKCKRCGKLTAQGQLKKFNHWFQGLVKICKDCTLDIAEKK